MMEDKQEQAFKLLDEGKSPQEVEKAFPGSTAAIKETLAVGESIRLVKNQTNLSKQKANSILSSVTKSEDLRYTQHKGQMNKIFAAIGSLAIVLLIALAGIFAFKGKPISPANTSGVPQAETSQPAQLSSGNSDADLSQNISVSDQDLKEIDAQAAEVDQALSQSQSDNESQITE